jgi:hypothetical protein
MIRVIHEPDNWKGDVDVLTKACDRANRVLYRLVPKHGDDKNLVQIVGVQPVNWSRVYLRKRSRWCRYVLHYIPRRYTKLRRFIEVWVFTL